jgi:hypothetical protein
MHIDSLSHGQLDFLVAGLELIQPISYHRHGDSCIWGNGTIYSPTIDETTGCMILVRERLSVVPCEINGELLWQASHPLKPEKLYYGEYLPAAMKCYVAHILSDEIDESVFI